MNSPQFQPLWETWKANLKTPFFGITNDGHKRESLYEIRDEGAPTKQMVKKDLTSIFGRHANTLKDKCSSKGDSLSAWTATYAVTSPTHAACGSNIPVDPNMMDPTMPEDRWNPADQVSGSSRG